MNKIILKNNESEHFKLISYPDGQHSLKLKLDNLDVKKPVSIICRIKTFSELEVLICLVSALRKNDFYISSIDFVYLFGMRSDRAFSVGEPNYFRDVLNPILKLLDTKLKFLLPHNLNQVENHYLLSYHFDGIVIGGDQSVCNWLFIKHFFIKERKENIIIKLNKNINEDFDEITIIDDLCDGGATFIAEGKYIKENFPGTKLKLFVYHGLFTKGLDCLLEYYDEIICTNSYQDINNTKVKQIKVI